MSVELDGKKVMEKAVELGYAARAVIQQLAAKDRTPEGLKAQELLENAIRDVVVNGVQDREFVKIA